MMRPLAGVLFVVVLVVGCKDKAKEKGGSVAAKPDAAAAAATKAAADAAAAPVAPVPVAPPPGGPGKVSKIGYQDAERRATVKDGETTYLGGIEPSVRWEHGSGTIIDLVVIFDESDETKARFVAVIEAGEIDLGPFLPVTPAEPTIFWRERSPTELVAGADDEKDHALRLTWDGAVIAVAERWTGDRVDAQSPDWVREAFADR